MLVGLVVVAMAMGVVYLHVLIFQALDDVIGVPLTLGVFALFYALFLILVYWDEIQFSLFPNAWARRGEQVAPVTSNRPAGSGLMSLDMVDLKAAGQQDSTDPVLVETAELLKAVRVGMHELLSECGGVEQPCQIVREDYGLVSAQASGGEGYHYLHEYVEVTSGYPPVRRKRAETLAHTWQIETDRHGHAEVTLTINAKRKGQLLLKSERRWFPADLVGWRELIRYLSRPE